MVVLQGTALVAVGEVGAVPLHRERVERVALGVVVLQQLEVLVPTVTFCCSTSISSRVGCASDDCTVASTVKESGRAMGIGLGAPGEVASGGPASGAFCRCLVPLRLD